MIGVNFKMGADREKWKKKHIFGAIRGQWLPQWTTLRNELVLACVDKSSLT